MKRIFIGFFISAFAVVNFISCIDAFSGYSNHFVQQQRTTEEEDYIPPSSDGLGNFGIMFEILEPAGVINNEKLEKYLYECESAGLITSDKLGIFEKQLRQLPIIMKTENSEMNFYTLEEFKQIDFSKKLIRASFNDKNVPTMWYIDSTDTNKWISTEESKYLPEATTGKYSNDAENTIASGFSVSDVAYFLYDGLNPFYAHDDNYNTKTFEKTEGDPSTAETFMKRFHFYRFEGNAIAVWLDNILVAVDTYTGLVFSCGIPTEFISMVGKDNPTKWDPVEIALDKNNFKHQFFEYDPAGYIDKDGKFIMYSWYTENLAKANKANQEFFVPQFTGVSPYLVNFKVAEPKLTVSDDTSNDSVIISNIHFANAPKPIKTYDLYRIDDSGTDRILVATIEASSDANYSAIHGITDNDALILRNKPVYFVEAKDKDGEVVALSQEYEGNRALTDIELANVIIDSLRYEFIDQGLHDLGISFSEGDKSNTINSSTSGSIEHTRNYDKINTGFLKNDYVYAHTYDIKNYQSSLCKIDGSLNYKHSKDVFSYNSIDTVSGKDANKAPFTGTITFESDYGNGTITFNNVNIANDDKNNPIWQDGTISVEINSITTEYTNTNFYFGLYMDNESYINKILGDE